MKNPKAPSVPFDVELEELKPSFEQIAGFVRKPSDNNPTPMRFCGVLLSVVEGEEKPWYVAKAFGEQHCVYTTQEDDSEHAVEPGMVVGLSHTGALTGLDKKIGHYFMMTYTGKKVPLKGGRHMWECKVQVSKAPVSL